MPRGLVALFAGASGMSVANVYLAQPLLDGLAKDFGVPHAAIGWVMTATQAGSLLALLLLVPLGDQHDRRRLVRLQIVALVLALCSVATAHATWRLMAGMLAVGLMGTTLTQGLIAYAASAAAPFERGRVVGAAQGGVVVGLLLARAWAGAVADLVGWRGVYGASAILMLLLAALIWKRLPAQPVPTSRMPYPRLVASGLVLLWHDRTLRWRGLLAMLMFAVLAIFWTALVLPLSAPPFSMSHAAIGALGILGAAGALVAGLAGRWADRGWAQRTSAGALVLMLAAWVPISLMSDSLGWLMVGIVLLDVGGQALHVTSQALIFRGSPQAHSRLVGSYMLFYAIGSGGGALASTAVFAHAGWRGVCVLGAGVSLAALAVWLASVLRAPRSSAHERPTAP